MNVFAIDIGGTKVALGLVSNNELIDSITFPTPKVLSIDAFVANLLTQKPDWLDNASCIAISTTGYVSEAGITAINPDTLDFPQPFPLQQAIENAAQKPTLMINDAQAAAWYEHQQSKCKGNMAYITVSTGVGGGIVINNRLIRGKNGLAGHLGHTTIANHTLCGCGQTGCVEALASGTAIAKQASSLFDATATVSNVALFSLAKTDAKVEAIIDQSAWAIANLCSNLKMTLDLDYIAIGGGIGLADGYLERVQKHIQDKPGFLYIDTVPAIGGQHSCLLGVAYLARAKAEDAYLC